MHGSFDARGYTMCTAPNGRPAFRPAAARGVGDANWSGAFSLNGTDGVVTAIVVDNGSNMYMGGSFTTVCGVAASNIAKWDGTTWAALGEGSNGRVAALAVDGSGNVYMGGFFTTAGGIAASNIAKWNGTRWSALGTGIDGDAITRKSVLALAVDGNGNLYAAGRFTTAGGVAVNNIAKWNGTVWNALGAGIGFFNVYITVWALVVDGSGNLYAGGGFNTAGSVPASSIAKWNGATWSPLGAGISGNVYALAIDGMGSVYAGGSFVTAGGVVANNIAKWNGSSWAPLGTGTNGVSTFSRSVFALTIDGSGMVYVGGSINMAGGVAVNNIARWNGTAWSTLGTGINGNHTTSSTVTALVAKNTTIFAGGSFGTAGGTVANSIAQWNTGTISWARVGTAPGPAQGINGSVFAVAVDSNGAVYVGGNFTTAGGIAANSIAKWNGTTWSALGTGILDTNIYGVATSEDTFVDLLAIDNLDNVYAGGSFTTAGGVLANGIAKWDGTTWSALGAGARGLSALAIDSNNNVYVGGFFFLGTSGGGGVAKWNGTTMTMLGTHFDANINALAIDGNGNVYAGGRFSTAGGVAANHVAKWNGTAWAPLGSGINGEVLSLALDGSGSVYVGGSFTTAGGLAANNIAKWNGTTWTPLGAGTNSYGVYALAVQGNVLFVGGGFTTAGGVAANNVAKWDGTTWTTLGTGTNDYTPALVPVRNGCYVGGGFTAVGDGSKPMAHFGYYSYTPLATVAAQPVFDLRIFPNPAGTATTIRLPALPGVTAAELTLLDALGRAVRVQHVRLTAAGATAEIALTGLPAGLYHLQAQAGGQQVSRALVVE